jgi:large subunit ribosomal protein L4e
MAETKNVEKKAPAKKEAPAKKAAPKKAVAPEPKPAKKTPVPKRAAPKEEVRPAVKRAPARKKPVQVKTSEVNVYSLDGKVQKSIHLPQVFATQFRPDIIRKAVNSSRANRRQPYGSAPLAGMRHSVSWPGKGRGMARTPRLLHGGGKGAQAPNTPGGRRAHPPRAEKDWTEKINKKEKALALKSALAAVGNQSIVVTRGHRVPENATVPMVVNDDFETLFDRITKDYQKDNSRPAYTKEAAKVLLALGLSNELDRAKGGIHLRAGRGKSRGRKYRCPSSILFVVDNTEKVRKCFGNLPGVDIVSPSRLNVELLAPGGDAGRLTVFSEKALLKLGGEE